MSLTVEGFNTRIRNLTNDADGVLWNNSELLDWLNDAQLAICYYLPEANSREHILPLPTVASGNLRSGSLELPDGANRILSLDCNVWIPDAGEPVALDSLQLIDRRVASTSNPDWSRSVDEAIASISILENPPLNDAGEPTALPITPPYAVTYSEYIYDERTPRQYWLIANTTIVEVSKLGLSNGTEGTVGIRGIFGFNPSIAEDSLTLPDIYLGPLINYVLYRCYLKEAPFANTQEWSEYYYSLFKREVLDKYEVNTRQTPYVDRSRRTGAVAPRQAEEE